MLPPAAISPGSVAVLSRRAVSLMPRGVGGVVVGSGAITKLRGLSAPTTAIGACAVIPPFGTISEPWMIRSGAQPCAPGTPLSPHPGLGLALALHAFFATEAARSFHSKSQPPELM